MRFVPYLLFVVLFSVEYLALRLNLIGRSFILAPELLTVITTLYLMVAVASHRRIVLAPKYFILFVIFSLHMLAGIVINHVEPGTVVVAMRTYLKFLPFFLLPAVLHLTERQFTAQLRFLLVIALLQLPVVLYQRLVQFRGLPTGDVIHGTLTISSVLSIVLISAVAIVIAFYLKRRLSGMTAGLLFFLLFLPTTLNETKGTLVLLPLALFVPALLAATGRQRLRRLIPLAVFGSVAFVVFVGVYDHFMRPRFGYGLTDFITDQRLIAHYLFGGAAEGEIEANKGETAAIVGDQGVEVQARVSRGDSVVMPFRVLSEDPVLLLSGLGVGNASESIIKPFSGRYADYVAFGANKTAFSQLVWEVGLVGLVLALVFLYLIYRDARWLSRTEGPAGAFALGWSAVAMIMAVSLIYKNIIIFNALGYLFWYFSGYVAAEALRRRRALEEGAVG